MGGKRRYRTRDYAVGKQLLTLRMRAELRQAELAGLLQVSQRTVHNIRVRVPCYTAATHLQAGAIILNFASRWPCVPNAYACRSSPLANSKVAAGSAAEARPAMTIT
jgi:hypothetical protein